MTLANQQLAAKVATSYIWSFFQKRTSLQEPWIAPMKQSNWVTILDRLNNSIAVLVTSLYTFPILPPLLRSEKGNLLSHDTEFQHLQIPQPQSGLSARFISRLAATFLVGHVPLHQSKYLWRRVASNQSHHLHGKTWWLLATPHLQKNTLKCQLRVRRRDEGSRWVHITDEVA